MTIVLAVFGLAPVAARADSTVGVFVATQGRVADTRSGLGGYSTPMVAGQVRTFQITGLAGVPTSGVSAVSVTLTAVNATGNGWIAARASGAGTPSGTALSYNTGDTVSNTAMLAVGADGKIAVLANLVATDLLIDVQGYFTPGSAAQTGGFVPLSSFRLVDTRSGLGAPAGQVATKSKIVVQATGVGGIPANATAVYASITVTGQAAAGWVIPFAHGAPQPAAGSLNFDDTNNHALASMIPLGSGGAFDILVARGGPMDLVVDIEGYAAAAVDSAAGVFNPVSVRLFDSRVAPNVTLAANATAQVTVAGTAGIPTVDDGTGAVALDVITSNTTGTTGGHLALWSTGQDEPATSVINYNTANVSLSALNIIAPAPDGTITIRNLSSGPVNVVLDAEGWFLSVKTGIDPTAPTPPDTPTPTPDPPATVTGPAVVGGRFTNGAGQGLAGLHVALTAADGAPEDGSEHTPPSVGTAVTGTDGTWTYTLPDPLPANLKALSDANGGVLNVTAAASGVTTDGTTMLGSDNVIAGVANGAGTTEQSAAARSNATSDTVAVHPLLNTDAMAPSEVTAAGSYASTQLATPDATSDAVLPAWQTNDGTSIAGYNPDMVGGTDYSTVHPDDNPCVPHSKVLNHQIDYTAVDETHAMWNASSWDIYNNSMSSSVAVAISTDGKHWSLFGSTSQSQHTGTSIISAKVGYGGGHQFDVPLYYQYKKYWYTCTHGAPFGTHYAIEAHGLRFPPGGSTYRWGRSVAYKDGGTNFYKAPVSHRWVMPSGSSLGVTHGTSTTFSIAVSAFGVGLTAATGFNADHMEMIYAGYAHGEHDIWGSRDQVHGSPGMLYSY